MTDDSTWFERHLTEKMRDPEFAAAYEAERAAIVRVRLTPAQRRAMVGLAGGRHIEDDYLSWNRSGAPSRVELTMDILAERGLVSWDEGIDEAYLTPSGWAALSSGRK